MMFNYWLLIYKGIEYFIILSLVLLIIIKIWKIDFLRKYSKKTKILKNPNNLEADIEYYYYKATEKPESKPIIIIFHGTGLGYETIEICPSILKNFNCLAINKLGYYGSKIYSKKYQKIKNEKNENKKREMILKLSSDLINSILDIEFKDYKKKKLKFHVMAFSGGGYYGLDYVHRNQEIIASFIPICCLISRVDDTNNLANCNQYFLQHPDNKNKKISEMKNEDWEKEPKVELEKSKSVNKNDLFTRLILWIYENTDKIPVIIFDILSFIMKIFQVFYEYFYPKNFFEIDFSVSESIVLSSFKNEEEQKKCFQEYCIPPPGYSSVFEPELYSHTIKGISLDMLIFKIIPNQKEIKKILEEVKVPSLFFHSTRDSQANFKTQALFGFQNIGSKNKHLVGVLGGGHFTNAGEEGKKGIEKVQKFINDNN